jgi:uncharacterized membrane protein YbhN (UPF0104 family)
MTLVRWRWLVRALGLECSRKASFRIGFMGVMLNLAPLGIVGGDAVKALLIAKKNPDYKSHAVASVFIDRFIGLLVMFICGTGFILLTGFHTRPEILARTFTNLVFIFTAGSIVGTAIVFLPFFAKGHFETFLEKIPVCGGIISRLTRSLLLYRSHPWCLIQSCLATLFVHLSFGFSLYWIAAGLFPSAPDLTHHMMLYNVANLTSMIPLAAGPFELVLEQFYQLLGMSVGAGLVTALTYRLTAILVAVAGVVCSMPGK